MTAELGEIVHEVKQSPWRLGVIYFNPDDRRLVVRQRRRIGWTLNMAKPIAWVLLAPVIALILRELTHRSEK
jgi:uncharacterized membrane protein